MDHGVHSHRAVAYSAAERVELCLATGQLHGQNKCISGAAVAKVAPPLLPEILAKLLKVQMSQVVR